MTPSAAALSRRATPIGIRPLYYGYDAEGAIIFASEAKNLVGLVHDVLPFRPVTIMPTVSSPATAT